MFIIHKHKQKLKHARIFGHIAAAVAAAATAVAEEDTRKRSD